MNPSTAQILDAVERCPSDSVIVLPNMASSTTRKTLSYGDFLNQVNAKPPAVKNIAVNNNSGKITGERADESSTKYIVNGPQPVTDDEIKTLKDSGCGYYPNSYFVHVDVRPAGAGHVYWIDTSGPGEKPNYVKQWPLPPKLPPLPDPLDAETGKPVPATTDEATIGDVDEAPASKDAVPESPTTMPMP